MPSAFVDVSAAADDAGEEHVEPENDEDRAFIAPEGEVEEEEEEAEADKPKPRKRLRKVIDDEDDEDEDEAVPQDSKRRRMAVEPAKKEEEEEAAAAAAARVVTEYPRTRFRELRFAKAFQSIFGLFDDPQGKVYLVWSEKGDGVMQMHYSNSSNSRMVMASLSEPMCDVSGMDDPRYCCVQLETIKLHLECVHSLAASSTRNSGKRKKADATPAAAAAGVGAGSTTVTLREDLNALLIENGTMSSKQTLLDDSGFEEDVMGFDMHGAIREYPVMIDVDLTALSAVIDVMTRFKTKIEITMEDLGVGKGGRLVLQSGDNIAGVITESVPLSETTMAQVRLQPDMLNYQEAFVFTSMSVISKLRGIAIKKDGCRVQLGFGDNRPLYARVEVYGSTERSSTVDILSSPIVKEAV